MVYVYVYLFWIEGNSLVIRHGTTNRRHRNRGGSGRRHNQQKMQVFDSNGPDVRIRGTAHQVTEKYLALAKDAASSDDRSHPESYLQHAEHYQRIINEWVKDNAPVHDDKNAQNKKADASKQDEEDLSLPSSILGEGSKVESQEKAAEAAV